ncbi:MAG: LysR family transcriptional regulator [Kofleriaceae bacterium]
MDLATLDTFVEVMQRGSFAAVARARNVDPSSVSRAIAALEAHLAVRLFHRTTRHLAPTEAALAYLERIAPLLDQLAGAAQVAADHGDTPRGVLRITAAVSFAQVNLIPLLPAFTRRYPDVGFELLLDDARLDLVDARIDLAIRLGRLAESSLVAHRLCPMTYVVAGSPDYLRRRGRPRTPADLARHACLRYPVAGHGPRWRFRTDLGQVSDVPIRGPVTVANGVALRQCAVAGMGIVVLPRWTVADELRRGALVELFADHQVTPSEFDLAAWLLYPSRSYLPLKVRRFSEFLLETFRHGAPAEVGLAPARRRR